MAANGSRGFSIALLVLGFALCGVSLSCVSSMRFLPTAVSETLETPSVSLAVLRDLAPSFRVELFQDGRVRAGSFSSLVERRTAQDKVARICEVLKQPPPDAIADRVVRGESEVARLRGLSYVVIDPGGGGVVAFPESGDVAADLEGTQLGEALKLLDRLLARRFRKEYCFDRSCETAQLSLFR